MKVSKKVKWFGLISLALIFCFAPLVNMPYQVIVQQRVPETYTTVEPYTVQEEVKEPHETWVNIYDPPSQGERRTSAWRTIPTTEYRTVLKEVTKYREVTKTRMVYHPVVETRTRRVSILRYLLR